MTYFTNIHIFVRIWSTLLSNNNCVYSFIDLDKKVHINYFVTINYIPKRETLMFSFPSYIPPDNYKRLYQPSTRFNPSKILQTRLLSHPVYPHPNGKHNPVRRPPLTLKMRHISSPLPHLSDTRSYIICNM